MSEQDYFHQYQIFTYKPTSSPGPFPNLTKGPGDEVDIKLYVAKIASYQIGQQRMGSCFIRN